MDVDMRSPLKETDVNTNSPIYTRSRSSYNSLPNSMDTCTLSTDYIDDLAFDAEEVNEQSWGKLFPVGACFKSVGMFNVNNCYQVTMQLEEPRGGLFKLIFYILSNI